MDARLARILGIVATEAVSVASFALLGWLVISVRLRLMGRDPGELAQDLPLEIAGVKTSLPLWSISPVGVVLGYACVLGVLSMVWMLLSRRVEEVTGTARRYRLLALGGLSAASGVAIGLFLSAGGATDDYADYFGLGLVTGGSLGVVMAVTLGLERITFLVPVRPEARRSGRVGLLGRRLGDDDGT